MASSFDIFLSVLNGILATVGGLENILVLTVIFTNKELQKGLNHLIASLCCADFLICAFLQVVFILDRNGGLAHGGYIGRQVVAFFQSIIILASYSHLIAITIYRWRMLSRPYSCLMSLSKKTFLYIIAVVWCASVAVGALFQSDPGYKICPWFYLTVTVSLAAVFISMHFLVKRHRRKIALQAKSADFKRKSASIDYEKKAAKTTTILVGVSIILHLPVIFIRLIDTLRAHPNTANMATTIRFATATFHPSVFICRSGQFHKVLSQIITRLRRGVNTVHTV